MSESVYRVHPVHTNLKQLLDLQGDDELVKAKLGLSEDQNWQFDRVFEVARVVDALLANTPTTLTSIGYLNNIANLLQQAFAELSNFRANKNPGHVANASSHAENIIPQLGGFAVFPARLSEEGLEKIIDDLRGRSQSAISVLLQGKNQIALEVENLRKVIAEQEQRISELTAAVDTQKKEAIAVTAEVRTEYSKTEADLRNAFTGSLNELKTGFTLMESTAKKSAEDTLTEMRRKEEEAKRIVQVVGNIGVTGNYQNAATNEAKIADTFRWMTIGFFGAGVLIAVVVLVAHLFPSLTPAPIAGAGPWELGLRLLTALAIATPAFYTARESARHRTNSDRAKQRELELASLGPFIELLPKETKDQIVSKLSEKYFGTDVEPHDVKAIIETKDVIDLAKQAIEGLTKAAK